MSKDTFYFSHDYNARNDEKILSLRMSLGWEGYGLYWALIEKLRESKDYMLSLDFNLIAFDLRTDNQKIKSIVTGFGLFSIDKENGKFYSESLLSRMQIKESKSQKAREAAQVRWSKKPKEHTESMQTHNQCITDAKQLKESKVKESKELKNNSKELKKPKRFSPPSIQEVENYFFDKTQDLEKSKNESVKYHSYYESKNWMVGKNKMKNWKSAVTGWIARGTEFEKEKKQSPQKKEKITAAQAFKDKLNGVSSN